ncbi:uncharacterized protein VTP21DRAFT_2466 [Calcarisporiella thermophila]|uniref:uncharacterized protein n=1 Tax=Calcarisporiella thermophila TaxID=911321 RepID=UPI003743C8E8
MASLKQPHPSAPNSYFHANPPPSSSSSSSPSASYGLARLNSSLPPTPSPTASQLTSVLKSIARTYKNKIKPIETHYNFPAFASPSYTDADIFAKPMVLLLGQYSTGKTTFIRRLLGQSYPGEHIGVEPTTDRFIAIMHSNEERVLPGNAAASHSDLPFGALNKFGQQLLSRFQVSQLPNEILQDMTLIDTPGILAGDKQINRGYDFHAIIEWFIERSDMILLFFDGHKLDISNEFKLAIDSLKGHEEKVRVILNKCDTVPQHQLMRIYGALMWSLGKVVGSPEVPRVYLGSFWVERPQPCFEDARALLQHEEMELLADLKRLPINTVLRKISTIVKRARLAKVHAYIVTHLRREMPLFGKQKKQQDLIARLDAEFVKLQQRHQLASGDFPEVERYRQALKAFNFDRFASRKDVLFSEVDDALTMDIPRLVQSLPVHQPLGQQPLLVGAPPNNDPPPAYSQ